MRRLFIYLSIFFLSCTKVIRLPLSDAGGQLDIEANVTNVAGPQQVVLRRNVAFSATNDYPAVSGAIVVVVDEAGNSYDFVEGVAGTYTSRAFAGRVGVGYRLQVGLGGQTYSASSTMPSFVRIDSLTASNRPLNRHQDGRDQKVVTLYYQDPPGESNQYRFIEWVNGVQVKSVFTYDDQLTDGSYVSFDLLEQDIDIYPGDTVRVEMQCVDEPIYTYWFSLESQQANNFNGAVAPANPPSNVDPTTLGYFSVHSTQSLTLLVK